MGAFDRFNNEPKYGDDAEGKRRKKRADALQRSRHPNATPKPAVKRRSTKKTRPRSFLD